MSYKVTISDAVLEECIEHVTFNVDTPSYNEMRHDSKNSMIITGKIDTDEVTTFLYKWALLPATNPDCYKKITVEYTKDNQLVRKVCFSKAFVVDYSESYSNYSGVGTFTLYVRQFRGKDIECVGEATQPSTVESSVLEEIDEEIEVAKKQTPVAKNISISKSAMSFTDRIAKQKEMKDNSIIKTATTKIEITSKEQIDKKLLETKPKMSKDPEKWINKGGKITIDETGTWTYHDWEGNSVSYPDGYPDFKSAGMVKQEVPIGKFEVWNKDFPKADKLAPNGPKNTSNTWHHHQDGTTMQEINAKLHSRFTHVGGMSKVKK